MDTDPNAYTILGFVTEDVNNPTLTPVRNERAVFLVQKSGATWNEVFVQEPWRDSNKLYASVRGIASGEPHFMDLEDFGIAENEILKPNLVENLCTTDLSSFKHFLGGAWVGTPSVSDEGASLQIEDGTRVGVAVHDRNQWQFLIFKVGDGFPNKQLDRLSFMELLNQKLDLTTADLILPFLEPKRIMTPRGVVFFG